MNKREMIERALGQVIEKIVWYYRNASDAQISVKELIEYLAEQIVIECEVRYHKLPKEEFTTIHINGDYLAEPCVLVKPGIIGGTPGKALAIILSLEKE